MEPDTFRVTVMFFVMSKILSRVLYPLALSLFLLAAAFGLFRRKPRAARTLLASVVLILWICSTEWFSSWIIAPLESRYPRNPDVGQVGAVIVLTGMVDLQKSTEGAVELEASADRIIEGVLLARRHPKSRLILSGGSGDLFQQGKSEALLLSARLVPELGIPRKRILVEAGSRNTFENARETARILRKHGLTRPVLVTSARHMPRAMACFKKQGIDPVAYPVDFRSQRGKADLFSFLPRSASLARTDEAIHEYVGLLIYRMMGYIG